MAIFSCFKQEKEVDEVDAYFQGKMPKPSLKKRVFAGLRRLLRSPKQRKWERRAERVQVLLAEYEARKAALKAEKAKIKGLEDLHFMFEDAEREFAELQAEAASDDILAAVRIMFETEENMNILRENVRLTRAMYEFNTYYERQMKLMLADLKVLEHEVALVETDLNSEYIAQYENLKDMRDLHAEQIDQAEYQLLLNENRMLRIYKQAELAGGDWDKAEMDMVTVRVDNLCLGEDLKRIERSMRRHAFHNLTFADSKTACRLLNNGFRY